MMVLHVIEHGGNIMLNVGPDADGVIPSENYIADSFARDQVLPLIKEKWLSKKAYIFPIMVSDLAEVSKSEPCVDWIFENIHIFPKSNTLMAAFEKERASLAIRNQDCHCRSVRPGFQESSSI